MERNKQPFVHASCIIDFVSANWAKYQGAKNLTLVARSGRENLCRVVMVYRFFYRKPMES